jgi:hypothetical protein
VRSHCPEVDVLVEHVTAQTMAPALDHVRRHLEPPRQGAPGRV